MFNKIVEEVRKRNKKAFMKEFALPETNGKVKVLRKIEAQIKQAYNVNPEVVYVHEKHKVLFSRSTIRGFYSTAKKEIVVYINDDYKANVTTLCHELTHSYQHAHQTEQYAKSLNELKSGKVSYWNSWHERDAREQADIMSAYFVSQRRRAVV